MLNDRSHAAAHAEKKAERIFASTNGYHPPICSFWGVKTFFFQMTQKRPSFLSSFLFFSNKHKKEHLNK